MGEFMDIKKVENSLEMIKEKENKIKLFFDELNKYDAIIIGGFIRDAINNKISRDIDIILNEENKDIIEQIILKYNLKYQKNRFNGYKINFNNFTLDIWYIKDHNVFKKGIYEANFNNLKETTFINYDALFYDIKTKTLDIKYYLDCLNNKTINFVGNKEAIKANESLFLSIAKILYINYLKEFSLSKEVQDYILKYYDLCKDNFIYILKDEYKKHYHYDMCVELEDYIENTLIKRKFKNW